MKKKNSLLVYVLGTLTAIFFLLFVDSAVTHYLLNREMKDVKSSNKRIFNLTTENENLKKEILKVQTENTSLKGEKRYSPVYENEDNDENYELQDNIEELETENQQLKDRLEEEGIEDY